MTFQEELEEVSLRPGTNGIFDVSINDEVVYSKQQQGRFPESSELKQLIRDRIAPEKDLGHSERK